MIPRLQVSTPSWTTRRTGIIEEPISPLPTVTLRHGVGGIRARCRCTALEPRFHWQWLLRIIPTLRASRLRPAGRSQRRLDFFQRLPLRHSGPGKEALCKAGHFPSIGFPRRVTGTGATAASPDQAASLASFLSASAKLLQLLATSGDLQPLRLHFKTEPMTDFIFEPLDFIALELDDSFTILANDVAMVGMLGVVRVVEFVVLAEIHLPHQSALRQQRQSAINRRAGNRFVPPPRPFEQLLGGEMLVGAENAVDDGLPLRSEPQVSLSQKIDELLFCGLFLGCGHAGSIF